MLNFAPDALRAGLDVNLTGHISLGGDRELEYTSGSIETVIAPSLAAGSTFYSVLADAAPSVNVSMTGGTQPGSTATIELRFENAGAAGNAGFEPFIDVLIPVNDTEGDTEFFGQHEIAVGAGIAFDASLVGTYGTVEPTRPRAGHTLAIVAFPMDADVDGLEGQGQVKYAVTSSQLIEINVNQSAGTATRTTIGTFDYSEGGVSLDDIEGLSIDQWGRLWSATGANDSTSYDKVEIVHSITDRIVYTAAAGISDNLVINDLAFDGATPRLGILSALETSISANMNFTDNSGTPLNFSGETEQNNARLTISNLVLTKSIDTTHIDAGDTVTVTLTATNNGNDNHVTIHNDGDQGEVPTDADEGPLDSSHREAFTTLNTTPDDFIDIEIDAPPGLAFTPRAAVTFTITAGNLGDQNGDNVDLSGRELLQCTFESFNHFFQRTGFDDRDDWYNYRERPLRRLVPLPVDPIYSGLAEPGTNLRLKIFNDGGRNIGSRSVVAGTGGNWIASLPRVVVCEHPHAMTVEIVGALHTRDDDSQCSTQRYFQPASHPNTFFSPRPTVQGVMQDAPSQVMMAIHDAHCGPLQFGAANHSYDPNVASNSTAGW